MSYKYDYYSYVLLRLEEYICMSCGLLILNRLLDRLGLI